MGATVVAACLTVACGDESSSKSGAGAVRELATAPEFADCPVATGVFDIAGSPSDAAATTTEPASVSERDAIAAAMETLFQSALPTFPFEYPAAPAPYEFVEIADDGDDGAPVDGRRIVMVGADFRRELDLALEPYGPTGWRVAAYSACQEILERFNPADEASDGTFDEVDGPEG